MVGQGDMHYAALGGRHRFEGYGSAGVGHATGHAARHVFERLLAALLVAFDVYHQVGAVVYALADDVPYQELECLEGVAFAPDEQAGVVPFYLEDGASEVFVVRLLHGNHGVDVHEVDEGLDHLRGDGYAVGQGLDFPGPDYGGFRAYAEYAGLASTNDVYFYVGAICVQFL